ncbi:nucleolin [Nematocida minor]|uniref:nucleolin n=1 Tax=Nematocida minor TaxID=1912983 RepID=UPI002220B317|nr:nucleolin [Nematocida minor]KAI5190998.1 nucleolin [Nematocida minor]
MAVRKTQNKKEEKIIEEDKVVGSGSEEASSGAESEEQTASDDQSSNNSASEASESPTETGSEEEASEEASAESEKQAEPEESKDDRTVFIKGISFNATEEDLKDLFGKFGNITEVRIPKNRDGVNGKGFGYVEFDNKESCIKSKEELNETEFGGRTIIVDLAKSGPRNGPEGARNNNNSRAGEHTVFLGNIPFDVEKDDFLSHLKGYADIKQLRIPEDRETGRPKGFAFASFESDQEAQKLINSNITYMDRPIRAQMSEKKASAGPRGGSFGREGGFGGRRDGGERSSGFGKRSWSSENTSNKRHVKFE